MPDIRSHATYTSRVTGLEREYLRAVNARLVAMRLELMAVMERIGVAPGLDFEIRRVVEALSRELAITGAEFAPGVMERASWYFGKAIESSIQVDLVAGSPGSFLDGAAFRVVGGEITRALGSAPLQWGDALRAALVAEAQRLRLSQTPQDEATRRLLSPQITGGRASAWRRARGTVILGASLTLWASANMALGRLSQEYESQTGVQYQRQAIAAIDERTTDCCLRVHGQIRPLDKPFKLEGTPRFADEVMGPPFHWYCRTSQALYHPRFEAIGRPTKSLRQAANQELADRERTGERREIHPASATSRRW